MGFRYDDPLETTFVLSSEFWGLQLLTLLAVSAIFLSIPSPSASFSLLRLAAECGKSVVIGFVHVHGVLRDRRVFSLDDYGYLVFFVIG